MTRLFKFRPLDKYAFDILNCRRLYLSDWRILNDPHEAQMLVVDKEHPNFRYHANPERLAKISKSSFDIQGADARVCSLSKNWHSNLLWSHYADQHRGIAIGLDLPQHMDRVELIEVIYDGVVPEFSPPISAANVRVALSHKSKEWKYETEVRLLSIDPEYKFLEEIEIKEITFGLRASRQDIQSVAEMVRGKGIGFFQICIKPGTYILNKSDIRYEYEVF